MLTLNFLLAALVISKVACGASIGTAVVIKPVANMYSAGTENADVVSQAICGTSVRLLEEKDGWVKGRTPDQYTGWIRLASLRRLSSGDPPYASAGHVAQVQSLFADLYREADVTKHQPLLIVPFETRLEVVDTPATAERRWIQVRLPDDRLAWIQRGDVSFEAKPLSVKATINLAKRFMGLTYLWGGTSTFGFDCSGFTQMLMRARGVTMPRDADLQAAWDGVIRVKRRSLKAGDLLFFGESPQKITHTGMYIGHGKFIHDTTHGHPGVQISRLADQPWTTLLVACRRVQVPQTRKPAL
jgi:gamma-D-glutamyl-L-lysine dipeptidyl-peptidase